VFIDGEILMMISARELVEPQPRFRAEARQRAAAIEKAMKRGPVLSAESYPNECWMFCNTTALAALAMFDRVDGSDHSAFIRSFVDNAKKKLTDDKTGLLVSSYTHDGKVLDGPEGSSIWMTIHNLSFIDPAYARDQYARARKELGMTVLGFGLAREWPDSWPNKRPDVDSGPIVPILDASAGSSGMAILGAAAAGDEAWLNQLLASVELAGFPDDKGHARAGNAVGDAVMFYALSIRGESSVRGRVTSAVAGGPS
jgi:hypothetical protein